MRFQTQTAYRKLREEQFLAVVGIFSSSRATARASTWHYRVLFPDWFLVPAGVATWSSAQ